MTQNVQYANPIPKIEFNPATLTGSFQPLNGSGFDDTIKVWKLYNGSTTVSIELSFDGVTPHDFMPPLGTCIIDFQTNHDTCASYGTGTKAVRKGQIVYGRTAPNPTYLQLIGYN